MIYFLGNKSGIMVLDNYSKIFLIKLHRFKTVCFIKLCNNFIFKKTNQKLQKLSEYLFEKKKCLHYYLKKGQVFILKENMTKRYGFNHYYINIVIIIHNFITIFIIIIIIIIIINIIILHFMRPVNSKPIDP